MMAALKLSDIARQTGGELSGDACVEAVCTDSRRVRTGDLFVALAGEKFDGNRFVEQAVAGGAVAVIITRDSGITIPKLRVENSRLALGLIARMNRRRFDGPLIALTGSAGKTTCKEMIAGILKQCGEVLATEANFNNEIGVPLTLLKLEPRHQFAVIEMGASRADDIRYLTQFAEPTIALVTNAMAAHIEGFGDLETVARTKGQILESVAGGGVAIINIDDVFADQWRGQAGNASIVTISLVDSKADFYSREIEVQSDGSTRFVLCTPVGEVTVISSFLGAHNVFNAIAATAASSAAGADLAQIKAGLESVKPMKGRLVAHHLDGRVVIDDSYNANPGSVKAAVDVLVTLPGVRCLILGEMAELGGEALVKHKEVAAYARSRGIERLIMVGRFAKQATGTFGEAYTDVERLLEALDQGIDADAVLVKGSRSAAMERVVEALIDKYKKREKR